MPCWCYNGAGDDVFGEVINRPCRDRHVFSRDLAQLKRRLLNLEDGPNVRKTRPNVLFEAGQDRQRQRARRRIGRKPDRDPPGQRFRGIVDVDLGLLDLLQQQLGMPVQNQARLGRRDAGIAARQKLVLEMAFKRRNLLRQRRLRGAQNAGGAGNAAGIDDLHEALQFCEINAHGPAASRM
jgi:hypothetical protein